MSKASERFDGLEFDSYVRIIVDKTTGVQYLHFARGYHTGPAITVLVDRDGKPLIDKRYSQLKEPQNA